jgi:hypothetical protein
LLMSLVLFFVGLNSQFILKRRVEKLFEIKLPRTARDIQLLRSGAYIINLDSETLALFQVRTDDLKSLTNQFNILSSNDPDPQVLLPVPLNYPRTPWPKVTECSAPQQLFAKARTTWTISPKPLTALACQSQKYDCLQVQLWKLPDQILVILYADIN